jgi:hypothetical protein
MKKYKVKVQFIFNGIFRVNAENSEQALEDIRQHCGLVMSGGIHTNLNDEDIDWDFNTHPEKQILGIKQIRNKHINFN